MSLEKIIQRGYGFATYPSVVLYHEYVKPGINGEQDTKKWEPLNQLLFGDWIKPILTNGQLSRLTVKGVNYFEVFARGSRGYITEKGIQYDRVLEVNFIDVGQGDGCHLVTPQDEHYIIDAGKGDNMARFLRWRFNMKKGAIAPPVFKAVISHPDSDHYKGFGYLFSKDAGTSQQFRFSEVYHNGILEMSGRPEGEELGGTLRKGNITYIEELYEGDAEVKENLANGARREYKNTLKIAADKHPEVQFKALWKQDLNRKNYLYQTGDLSIEVLAPLIEKVDGKKVLRYFKSKEGNTNDIGRTKNGHSVVLKLQYGKVKILLGGDLNPPAEDYLLEAYTGSDIRALKQKLKKAGNPAEIALLEAEIKDAETKARDFFQVDFAKSCHHGSADFTSEFLHAIHPLATIISSGDDEPHSHPRPETLGTIGKYSRGERSLIFCTELMRSGKEFMKIKNFSEAERKVRLVTVYGMINLRTDGSRAIIAQKLERKRSNGSKYDLYKFEWNEEMQQMQLKMKL